MGAGRVEPALITNPSALHPPGLFRQPTGTGGGGDGGAGARRAFGVPPSLFTVPYDTLPSLFPPCSPTSTSVAGCTQDSAPAACLQARGGVSEAGGVCVGVIRSLI